jgi:hypothetical protein
MRFSSVSTPTPSPATKYQHPRLSPPCLTRRSGCRAAPIASLGPKVCAVTVIIFVEFHQAFLRDRTVLLVFGHVYNHRDFCGHHHSLSWRSMPKLAAWVPQNGLSCESKKPSPSLTVSKDKLNRPEHRRYRAAPCAKLDYALGSWGLAKMLSELRPNRIIQSFSRQRHSICRNRRQL